MGVWVWAVWGRLKRNTEYGERSRSADIGVGGADALLLDGGIGIRVEYSLLFERRRPLFRDARILMVRRAHLARGPRPKWSGHYTKHGVAATACTVPPGVPPRIADGTFSLTHRADVLFFQSFAVFVVLTDFETFKCCCLYLLFIEL